jgi:protein-S-isoprenylcysteine O-methyltransferase Ste14
VFPASTLPGVAEPSEHASLPSPPPLPPRLADPVPAIIVCTALWFLAFVALLVARLAFKVDDNAWLWTCSAGTLLGVTGYGVFRWQRRAARRGSRGAQRGLQP